MTYRPSIAERIAWTSGRLGSAEARVLVALWSCGDYETGHNCRPYVKTIVGRSGLSRATVFRALASLREKDQPGGPWIVAVRRHRRPTVYDLCLDRLAIRPPKEQQMTIAAMVDHNLESQNETQEKLESHFETQDPDLESQNETPTSDPDLDLEVRTHTPRAREADHNSESQIETQGLPLLGPTPPTRCAHPHAHAWCEGRVHVPRDLHFEFLDKLGTQPGESPAQKSGRLVAFYARTLQHLSPSATIGDSYAFWKGAYLAWVQHTRERETVERTLNQERTTARTARIIAEGRAARERKSG